MSNPTRSCVYCALFTFTCCLISPVWIVCCGICVAWNDGNHLGKIRPRTCCVSQWRNGGPHLRLQQPRWIPADWYVPICFHWPLPLIHVSPVADPGVSGEFCIFLKVNRLPDPNPVDRAPAVSYQ